MQIVLETADVKGIRELAGLGIVDGITTGPSLVARPSQSFSAIVDALRRIVDGPVHLGGSRNRSCRPVDGGARWPSVTATWS